jgi:prolyl oligopeptidase
MRRQHGGVIGEAGYVKHRRAILGLLSPILAALFAAPAPADPAPPPPARITPVVDDYFGTKITDNYRWMESEPEPEFRQLLEAQDTYARAMIARVPGRDQLLREIGALDGRLSVVLVVTPVGHERFYVKRAPGARIGKLYVRDADTGAERLLVDPEALGGAKGHAAIDHDAPSPDGRLIAYGVSSGGSEASVLHVMDVATGKTLPDVIDHAEFAAVSWLPDGSGFFYTRSPTLAADAPAAEQFAHLRTWLHHLGDDPAADRLVLDADHLPFDVEAQAPVPAIVVTPGSDQALAVIGDGTQPENAFFTAPLSDVVGGTAVWKQVAAPSDGASAYAVHGSTIYLLSHKDAPRFRIVAEDLRAPGFAGARTVIAQTPGVLTGLAASSEALYVAERTGGGMTLSRLAWGAMKPSPIALPYTGTIYPAIEDAGALSADPREPGAVFQLDSWVRPPTWFSYDPADGKIADTGITPKPAIDVSPYEALETSVRSPDGTMIPLSIVYRRGIRLDHSHPTLLEGYGNFGVPMDPSYRPSLAPWLDRGGVYAVAHVRGGGELGEPWHRAGMLANKQNTIIDYIACAEALVRLGYTSKARLAGEGTSGGGLTIGGAITRRPDLFAAAVSRVGATNALRFEQMKVGAALVPEYGSVKDAKQFADLLRMDAYQQVKDGTPYPAVLLTAGFNDPRVMAWMPAKMAARLRAATSSGRPVLFRVEFDAGHGIGSTIAQRDAERADEYAFLLWRLGVPGYQPH